MKKSGTRAFKLLICFLFNFSFSSSSFSPFILIPLRPCLCALIYFSLSSSPPSRPWVVLLRRCITAYRNNIYLGVEVLGFLNKYLAEEYLIFSTKKKSIFFNIKTYCQITPSGAESRRAKKKPVTSASAPRRCLIMFGVLNIF